MLIAKFKICKSNYFKLNAFLYLHVKRFIFKNKVEVKFLWKISGPPATVIYFLGQKLADLIFLCVFGPWPWPNRPSADNFF